MSDTTITPEERRTWREEHKNWTGRDSDLVVRVRLLTALEAAEGEVRKLRQKEAAPRAPRWTTEPPKVPGWYWFSVCKGHAVCILVCDDGKAKLAKDHFTDAELLGGEWAGPIQEPAE